MRPSPTGAALVVDTRNALKAYRQGRLLDRDALRDRPCVLFSSPAAPDSSARTSSISSSRAGPPSGCSTTCPPARWPISRRPPSGTPAAAGALNGSRLEVIIGDIRDRELLRKALRGVEVRVPSRRAARRARPRSRIRRNPRGERRGYAERPARRPSPKGCGAWCSPPARPSTALPMRVPVCRGCPAAARLASSRRPRWRRRRTAAPSTPGTSSTPCASLLQRVRSAAEGGRRRRTRAAELIEAVRQRRPFVDQDESERRRLHLRGRRGGRDPGRRQGAPRGGRVINVGSGQMVSHRRRAAHPGGSAPDARGRRGLAGPRSRRGIVICAETTLRGRAARLRAADLSDRRASPALVRVADRGRSSPSIPRSAPVRTAMMRPDGNALTFDVEEYFHAEVFAGVVRPEEWPTLESRVVRRHRAAARAPRRDAARRRPSSSWAGWRSGTRTWSGPSQAQGHEVACHGYGHQMITRLTRAEFAEDLQRAKATIEDAAGAR